MKNQNKTPSTLLVRMLLPSLAVSALIGCLESPTEEKTQDVSVAKSSATTANPFGFGAMGAKKVPETMLSAMRVSLAKQTGTAALPTSVDLSSKFPAPGDQGQQSSCVGWAVAYAAKSYQEAKEEGWNKSANLRLFSPAYVYNQINGGADGGSFPTDALNLLRDQGIDNLEFSPYNQFNFTTQPSALARSRAARYKAQSYSVLSTATDARTALAAGKPVVIAINIYADFSINSTNTVYDTVSGVSSGRHMIALVGYNDNFRVGTRTVPSFKFINSWGSNWGSGGYGWISASLLTNANLQTEIYSITDKVNVKGWDININPREMGDVNGDGKRDLVGFGKDGAYVTLSSGTAFGSPMLWNKNFGSDAGWDINTVKRAADVNGDNKADAVGFAYDGVYVALSNGSSFGTLTKWHSSFGFNAGGWGPQHRRFLGDVNGDGKKDIVGFAEQGVWVALSKGTSFGTATQWSTQYGVASGWTNQHTLAIEDVNNDGKVDVIGYGDQGVFVSLSNGSSFAAAAVWSNQFGSSQGWSAGTVRLVQDFNGDSKKDLIGISFDNVQVALSTGTGFQAAKIVSTNYGINDGFGTSAAKISHDVNGDKKADLIVCNNETVHVAISTGVGFNADASWLKKNFTSNSNEWYAP